METIYDVNYFIKKFEAIPEEKWIGGAMGWDGLHGKFCADGHCGTRSNGEITEEGRALRRLLIPLLDDQNINEITIVYQFNDGNHIRYQQPTPKQRILAALYDIKAMQEPKPEPKEKVVYKTVMIDSEVKQLTEKERCLQ